MKTLKCEICGNEYDEVMGECWNTINHNKKQEVSLGVKYKSLLKFNLFLNILIILSIVLCIVGCVSAYNAYLNGGAIIILIVFTLIHIYVITKIQMMLNFLFDLNEKIDN
mgnify:CR=1 FL=1